MSHGFKADEGTIFSSNFDLSGMVKIIRPGPSGQILEGVGMDVPGSDLISFVANHVRNEKVSKLEQASDEEVLGIV